MSVAIADAFRYVATSGTNAGEVDGTLTAPGVGGTLTIVGGFGITLTADTANRKITITNTGNGTGALTTITSQNSGTYYPVFTSIPGTFNPATGTYTSSTLYYESTTTPLSYNTTTGTLNVNSLVLGGAGTFSLDGVTSTGVTGTGNVVFGTSPTLVTPTLGAALATSINGLAITSSTGTFTLTNLKTFAVQNTITLAGTDSTTITLPATTGTVALNNQTFFLGSTSIAINRATASQSLTGITSIDGYSAGIAGGAIGYIPYQSAANTTLFVTGNTTTTPQFLTSTGTGSAAQAPTLTSSTGTGSVVLATSPSLTTPTLGVASATSINKMAITAPATSSTLAVADGKTFTVNNTITLAGTDSTTITLPATTGTVALNNQTMFIGSTSIAINRATASQSLTGITSIDGYSAGLAGGNATTLLGSLPYQSAANTTTLLGPNTTTTKKFLRQTGDGTNGAVPAWDTVTATDVGLSNVTNESKATMFTSPTFTGTVTMQQSVELFTSPSISANAVTLNFNNGAIFALGSNAANITANFTNIPGTAGQTISTTLIITQGATAYIPSAITINGGGSVTPKWQGGSAPSGTANRVDIVSFTFVCTATNTWTTIGSLTDYN